MAQATEIVTPEKVRQLQIALYRKAKAQPKYRFWSLYGELLRLDVLGSALDAQLRNDGGAGVDGESLASVESKRRGWLEQLREELRTKSYRPSPVLRVMIPKRSGGQRPLGIPTVKDRVVQTAVYLVLMPIWEADFHSQSYGFRPKRRAHQAINGICQAVHQGYVEIIDADLSNYFGTIPHRALMKMVARRVSDGSVLRLIKSWLRAPIVIQARCQGSNLKQWIEGQLEGWLGLVINREKTRTIQLRDEAATLDFLGYSFRYEKDRQGRRWRYLSLFSSTKSLDKAREAIRELTGPKQCFKPVGELIQELNEHLAGWKNYFKVGYCRREFRKINYFVQCRMIKHLNRRSQRGYKLPKGISVYAYLNQLGLVRL